MDIFEKCFAPSLAGELKEKGVYPYFHALQSRQDVEVQMEGKRRIMLGSNNYLGLTTDPEVIEAGIRALEQYGKVPAEAGGGDLRHRVPVQRGHYLRAGGTARLRDL